ncbi:hypothetical protein K438DRAFT_1839072, partial [Mycena galopus ATCC 62051]
MQKRSISWLYPSDLTQHPARIAVGQLFGYPASSWRGAVNSLQYIPQTQGFRGLYQGHTLTLTLARAIPHAAVGYTISDKASKLLMPTPEYQMSLIRVWMAMETNLSATRRTPGIFLVWETLSAQARTRLSPATRQANQTRIYLVVGAIAETVAEIFMYPLEGIHRTQQASGKGTLNRLIGFQETVRSMWLANGWRDFFTALGIGLFKQVPTHGTCLKTLE